MIKNLHYRFDLIGLQAAMIFFTLEELFKENNLLIELPNPKEII